MCTVSAVQVAGARGPHAAARCSRRAVTQYDEKFLQKMEETINQCVHLEGRFDEVMAAAASVRKRKETEADVLMPELPDPADAKFGHMIAANWNALDSIIQVRGVRCCALHARVVYKTCDAWGYVSLPVGAPVG